MCGIVGILATGGPDPELARAMRETLAHRGPDGSGRYADGRVALGMRRLAIVDAAGGGQPVFNEDGSVVAVLNGEIYNHAELRDLLRARGHRINSAGDSECLVHLYEEFGDEFVRHLRGMFAFALWDAGQGRLLLGRDRLGKKPLYWRRTPDGLQFASEVKAFLADPAFSRSVDPTAVHAYLACSYVPATRSIWRGVERVPPATLLSWQNGTVRSRRYWRLDRTERCTTPVEEAAAELRSRLLDATRVRLSGERRIGVMLSGGVDSSAVLAAAARYATGVIPTFTIGFQDAAADERHYARTVAHRYGTEHHEYVLDADVVALLPDLAWHFDEPFADSSAIATFVLARLASGHVTVVLNGDGGDEVFGGYERYALMTGGARINLPPRVGAGVTRMGSRIAARATGRRLRRAGRILELAGQRPVDRYAALMSTFSPAQRAVLYTPGFAEQVAAADPLDAVRTAWAQSRADSLTGRLLDVDTRTYLSGDLLPKMDIATMAHGVEARSPLLDQRLVEWAAALPGEYKVRGRTGKWLLKHAVADWVPAELIHRRKTGFGVPMDDWLRTGLRALAWDVLTDARCTDRGLFRPAEVRRLLCEHESGRNHGSRIWTLLQLELWYRRFVDGAGAAAPARAEDVRAVP